MLFKDRLDAGQRLAGRLAEQDLRRPVVLALPRGGVPVAAPVASALDAPLVPFVARKIGAPGHPEFGIGAVAEGADEVVVSPAAAELGLSREDLETLARDERVELEHRVDRFRNGQPLPSLHGRDVVLVDDGLATGVTAEAALRSIRRMHPRRLVFAVPVCAEESADRLAPLADDLICLSAPEPFGAVGNWYETFDQTSDEEVLRLVTGSASGRAEVQEREVTVELPDGGELHGSLCLPADAVGTVLFAHGSGSSRQSPRNRSVARRLHEAGLGTLLVDLLTETEQAEDEETRQLRFDISLLAERVRVSSDWLSRDPSTAELPLGYFGASTGAAAALAVAATYHRKVRAVVSRGGRPDLAGGHLREVVSPTLLIVGSNDPEVLELNRRALAELQPDAELAVVTGASHLFEEEGTLDEAADLAAAWFLRHLPT